MLLIALFLFLAASAGAERSIEISILEKCSVMDELIVRVVAAPFHKTKIIYQPLTTEENLELLTYRMHSLNAIIMAELENLYQARVGELLRSLSIILQGRRHASEIWLFMEMTMKTYQAYEKRVPFVLHISQIGLMSSYIQPTLNRNYNYTDIDPCGAQENGTYKTDLETFYKCIYDRSAPDCAPGMKCAILKEDTPFNFAARLMSRLAQLKRAAPTSSIENKINAIESALYLGGLHTERINSEKWLFTFDRL